ncbi:MAG: hypothetical protein KBD63_01385 [Bacteriovoracaceae bacterium]|nr:hypothetical protein [Bacteriovoracaceae bacterium]
MRTVFSTIERMLLETLFLRPKNFHELLEDTGLKMNTLLKALHMLQQEKLIICLEQKYSLSLQAIQKDSLLEKNKEREVEEISSAIIRNFFSQKEGSVIKVKKFWMSPKEETLFASYWLHLENFVRNLQAVQQKENIQGKIRDQKIIFWGESRYHDLVESITTQI